MPQVRNGDFQIVDLSGTLELVPRVDSLVTNMNLFTTHMGVTTVAQVERVKEVEFAIQAKQRGGERQFVNAETADLKNFNVPFFPLVVVEFQNLGLFVLSLILFLLRLPLA